MDPITKCPSCSDNKIVMTNFEVEPAYCTREIRCYACGQVWVETFSPTSFVLLDKLPPDMV